MELMIRNIGSPPADFSTSVYMKSCSFKTSFIFLSKVMMPMPRIPHFLDDAISIACWVYRA